MSTVITLEGGLFAADLIDTLATDPSSVAGQRPEDFGMAGLRLSDEMQSLFSQLQGQWDRFERRRLAASDTAVSITREAWLLPVLRLLDFDPQYQRASLQAGGQSYPISHLSSEGETAIPVHVAAFDDDLDRRGDKQRFSPHALVQDYLNRSDSLWGIVTNGRRLRILRDTTRLARPVYLEFDLEGIAAGNLYAEFARLFRLIHRSRFPAQDAAAHDCLLERWYQEGVEQGGRVRERLREGVEKALEIFGTGLLEHPKSTALVHHLEQGSLSPEAYYRQLLRLVYRLLFLMVAEERRLLFVDDPDKAEHQRLYTNWYSIEHLRERAMGRRGRDPHGDLWQGLCQAFRLFREEEAAAGLGLGVLDGELFSIEACQMLEAAHLRNDRLLDAVFRLSTFQETEGRSRRKRGTRRRVSFAALDVEELGSVYESLLDFHPHIDTAARRFSLVGGSERKTTGSYYTPKELVAELIKSALEPVLAERVQAAASAEEKARAILAMRVIDPACGSGHFLLAAARRMGRELARVRSGENEPSPGAHREAVRDVIRHCIYAVDKNPLAVDLCKVALWIESHTAGLPLSFLDHHVRRGDALIGVMDLKVLRDGIPDAAYKPLTGDDKATTSELRKRNKVEGKDALQHYYDIAGLERFARAMAELDAMPEDGIADIVAKTRCYRALHDGDAAWSRMKQASDLYCAAFFMPKTPATARLVPTRAHLRDALSGRLYSQVAAHLLTVADEQRFFHWPLEFPEVLQVGGFDVVLGNPPWERIKLQEQEFFAARDPAIADAPNKSARGDLIAALKSAPEGAAERVLHNAFESAKRAAEAASEFVRLPGGDGGRFPLTGTGDVNTYGLFAELFLGLSKDYAGVIVPTGIATDSTYAPFFSCAVNERRLAQLIDFENRDGIFPNVHRSYKFCLLTLGKNVTEARFAFFLSNPAQLVEPERNFSLSPETIRNLNPNTGTAPVLRTRADAEITAKLYAITPILVSAHDTASGDYWQLRLRTLFHKSKAAQDGHIKPAVDVRLSDPDWEPAYEGDYGHQYDHRFGTFERGAVRSVTRAEHADPEFEPEFEWVGSRQEFLRKMDYWGVPLKRSAILAFRRVARSTDERTSLAAIIPFRSVTNSWILVLDPEPRMQAALCGAMNSLVLDYCLRNSLSQPSIPQNVYEQLPVPRPSRLMAEPCLAFVVPKVLELTYTSHSLAPFARDLGCAGEPFRWDPDRRALLRAELDAYYAYLYGMNRDELRYILDPKEVMGEDWPSETFRVLKEREKKEFGEYRTRRLVLEAWDRFVADGTFDLTRLNDPTTYEVVKAQLAASREAQEEQERLMAKADTTAGPVLFVEGASDIPILKAAWRAFRGSEPLPVRLIAAGGTTQLKSLAARGGALKDLLGDRLVLALADNDGAGREVAGDKRVRQGGRFVPFDNGVRWALLEPTEEFKTAMTQHKVPEAYWPFTVEQAFSAATRRAAMVADAYGFADEPPADLVSEAGLAKKMFPVLARLTPDDEACFHLKAPHPEKKLAFSEWVTAPERVTHEVYAGFRSIVAALAAATAKEPA